MKGRRMIALLLALWLVLAAVAGAPAAQAAPLRTVIYVDTFDDELNDGGGDCSLREAIQAANANSGVDGCSAGSAHDTIVLLAGTYTLTLAGAGEDDNATGDIDVRGGMVAISGAPQGGTVIDGNQIDRVLHIHPGAEVEIANVTITGGRAPDGVGSGFSGAPGGGLYIAGGTVVALIDSTVAGNATGDGDSGGVAGGSGGSGGGIYNAGGTVTLLRSTVVSNTTGSAADGTTAGGWGGYGGGIYNSGVMTLTESTAAGNLTGNGGYGGTAGGAGGQGGGLYNSGILVVLNGAVMGNITGDGGDGGTASGYGGGGGGIYNYATSEGPRDRGVGAGRVSAVYSGTLRLVDSVVSGNVTGNGGSNRWSAGGSGGGILSNGLLSVVDSTIADNRCGTSGAPGGSGGDGGGLYFYRSHDDVIGSATLTGCTITGNAAGAGYDGGTQGGGGGYGGGIYLRYTIGERAEAGSHTTRGAVAIHMGVVVADSTVSGNAAGDGGNGTEWGGPGGDGGGIFSVSEDLIVTGSTISGNSAGHGGAGAEGGSGGGICVTSPSQRAVEGETSLTNCTISGNTAGSGGEGAPDGFGGGIYAYSTVTVTHSTISGNAVGADGFGGGIFVFGEILVHPGVKDTIVADNVGPGANGPDCFGTIGSYGYNLVETTTGCSIDEVDNPGTNITGEDPALGPLSDNGGATQTHALYPTSPAVDTGTCANPLGTLVTFDQRGWQRPMDGDGDGIAGCDMGAYERSFFSIYLPLVKRQF